MTGRAPKLRTRPARLATGTAGSRSRRTEQPRQSRILLSGNVYETALNRIRWVFDEFDGNVTVSFSGGKDSTVVTELALMVAVERGIAKLPVVWLDQECEFEATAAYATRLFGRPEIEPLWHQVPFRLFNATDHSDDKWLKVWDPDPAVQWVREQDPRSIKVNDYGIDRFAELLGAIGDRRGGAMLTGVRGEESPARALGLSSYAGYKWVTWSSKRRAHRIFHPIYDWTYRDVWKAIADGSDPQHPGAASWDYNEFYDTQFRYGVPIRNMRVSNYHHETAVHFLTYLQEAEPETWERATARLKGISTVGHLADSGSMFVHELPFMFGSWVEYHGYLVDNLVPDPADREIFRKHRTDLERRLPYVDPEKIAKAAVQAVVVNDTYFTKGNQFYLAHRDQARGIGQRVQQPGAARRAADTAAVAAAVTEATAQLDNV